ncbi:MAG: prepilin peptidase [Candidatus Hermodarchaeota archaeon]
MNSVIVFINFSSIYLILIIAVYLDIKFRKLSNKYLKPLFIYSLFINFIEFIFNYEIFIMFITIKLILLLIVFLITFWLFILRIIGGGDAKLILIVFLIHPSNYINLYRVLLFFLLFSLSFLAYMIIKIIYNGVKNKNYTFQILFNFYIKISNVKRIYIKVFYKSYTLTELRNVNPDKVNLSNFFMIYDYNKRQFQIIIHYRIPLIINLVVSYLILSLLIFVF